MLPLSSHTMLKTGMYEKSSTQPASGMPGMQSNCSKCWDKLSAVITR